MTTHGESHAKVTPEYRAWASAISRCEDRRNKNFATYGGRGISMSPVWRDSYVAFLRDMGRRPSSAHSLDRIDVDGDYAPGNCRWATWTEQERNRRNNRIVELNGRSMTLAEAVEVTGVGRGALKSRLAKGLSLDAAAALPYRRRRSSPRKAGV